MTDQELLDSFSTNPNMASLLPYLGTLNTQQTKEFLDTYRRTTLENQNLRHNELKTFLASKPRPKPRPMLGAVPTLKRPK